MRNSKRVVLTSKEVDSAYRTVPLSVWEDRRTTPFSPFDGSPSHTVLNRVKAKTNQSQVKSLLATHGLP